MSVASQSVVHNWTYKIKIICPAFALTSQRRIRLVIIRTLWLFTDFLFVFIFVCAAQF